MLMLGMEKFAIVRAACVALAFFGAGFPAIMKLDTPGAKTRWIYVSLLGAVGVFLITRGGPAAAPSKKASFAVARNAQRP